MYTGLTGKVKIGESTVAEVAYISNWSVESATDVIEITKLGNAFKEKLAGSQSWSASAEGAVCFDGVNTHGALFDAKKKGAEVSVEFYLDQTEASRAGSKDIFFYGKGYIESLSVDLSAEDKGNISISIAGNGELKLSEIEPKV